MKLIKNAYIYSTSKEGFEKSSISWDRDKIKSIGVDENKGEYDQVFEDENIFIIPAFINPYTKVGLDELYLDKIAGDDSNELSNPITPHYNTLDGVNFRDESFKVLLKNGFATVGISPGDKALFSGNILVANTYGETIDEMIIQNNVGLKGTFGGRLKHGENPMFPKTRVSTIALFRRMVYETIDYMELKDRAEGDVPINLLCESIIPILKREKKIFIHANRSDDIASAIRMKKEFNLKLVIIGAAEAYTLVDKIKENDIECIVTLDSKYLNEREVKNVSQESLNQLLLKNICVSIASDYQLSFMSLIDSLESMLLNRFSQSVVIKLLTINAAKILDISNLYGSLEVNKIANFIVYEERVSKKNIKFIVVDGKIYNKKGEPHYAFN